MLNPVEEMNSPAEGTISYYYDKSKFEIVKLPVAKAQVVCVFKNNRNYQREFYWLCISIY
jgi:hypothetical protein